MSQLPLAASGGGVLFGSIDDAIRRCQHVATARTQPSAQPHEKESQLPIVQLSTRARESQLATSRMSAMPSTQRWSRPTRWRRIIGSDRPQAENQRIFDAHYVGGPRIDSFMTLRITSGR